MKHTHRDIHKLNQSLTDIFQNIPDSFLEVSFLEKIIWLFKCAYKMPNIGNRAICEVHLPKVGMLCESAVGRSLERDTLQKLSQYCLLFHPRQIKAYEFKASSTFCPSLFLTFSNSFQSQQCSMLCYRVKLKSKTILLKHFCLFRFNISRTLTKQYQN